MTDTTENRKVQLGFAVDTTAAEAGFAKVGQSAQTMSTKVTASATQAGRAVGGIGDGAQQGADKADKSLSSLVGSIQRATAAMQAGEKGSAAYFEALADQRGVSKDALKPYLDDLRRAESATKSVGMSAAQTTAALRNVPAQMTDIVVSLQSGQKPLTVLMQQGGQLKDMFGGVGNAARAVGGYLAGMVSPLTVAGAALAGIGLAYYEGSKEADEFNRALVMTGNQSGQTVGGLMAMAAGMSQFGVSQSTAAAALTLFAQAGVQGTAELQRFASAAARLESAGGPAVAETAKAFAELAKSPLEASLKYNESMNYLTATTYQHIKALVEQGKVTEAATLAQNEYSNAVQRSADGLAKNLGYVQRAWNFVKKEAGDAWNAMLNIGRADEVDQSIEKVTKRLEYLRAHKAELPTSYAQETPQLEAQLTALTKKALKEKEIAAAQAAQAEQVKALAQWDKDGEQFATKAAKLQRDIAQARAEGAVAGKTQAEIEARIADIRAKSADKVSTPKAHADAWRKDMLESYARSMDELGKLTDRNSAATEGLTATQTALRDIMASPEFAAYNRRQQEEIVLAASRAQAAEDELAAKRDLQRMFAEDMADTAAYIEAQQRKTQTLQDQVEAERTRVAAIGLTREQTTALEVAQLNEAAAAKESMAAAYGQDAASQQLAESLREQAKALREIAGLKSEGSAKEIAEAARKKTEQAWDRTAQHIEDSITDALMRGFENGKDFASNLRDTVVNMFKTMVLQPTIKSVVFGAGSTGSLSSYAGILGAGSTGDAGGSGGSGGMGSMAGMYSSMGSWLTDFGGSFAGQVTKLGQYLSGYSNTVVSSWGKGLMTNASTIGQYANTAGTALGYINAAVAASKGQWGNAIGTAVGTYFVGPIGAAIGSAVGSWVDNAFSGGHEYTTGQGITGTFNSSGFSGRNYQDWRNNGSSGFFGLGASGSSSGTNYSSIAASTQKSLGNQFAAMQVQVAGFAASLGLSVEQIAGYNKTFKLALGTDVEANKKAIADLFSSMAADMSGFVVDSQYIREGETAADTLARLATSLSGVNVVLGLIDQTALSVSQAGGDAASKLADLFGGLPQFASATDAYYQQFYSESERAAKTTQTLAAKFAELGISMPGTMEQFRALVSAQDLSTDAGRSMYKTLIDLSGAFASVNKSMAATITTLGYSTYADYAVAAARAGGTPPPRFADGGYHLGGLRLVGERGPELEATGPSRIWNAQQLSSALSGGAGSSAAVVSELSALRSDQQAQSYAIARLMKQVSDVLTQWHATGMPEVRTA